MAVLPPLKIWKHQYSDPSPTHTHVRDQVFTRIGDRDGHGSVKFRHPPLGSHNDSFGIVQCEEKLCA